MTTSQSADVRLRASGPADGPDILALSLAAFGREHAPTLRTLAARVETWRESKSPTVVARDEAGVFLGFAFSKPNEAGAFARSDGQTAQLTQVAVVPEARGQGVGKALVDRSLKTLKLLGFSRVQAQLQQSVVPWYENQGWTVLPQGQVKAWIEPHIAQDDEWNSDFPRGSFSPILTVFSLPDYPFLAEIAIGEGRPLLEVAFDGATDDDTSTKRGVDSLLRLVSLHPDMANLISPALAAVIANDVTAPRQVRDLLRPVAGNFSPAGPPPPSTR
jgi:predicted N-acetyltransferase YhbS